MNVYSRILAGAFFLVAVDAMAQPLAFPQQAVPVVVPSASDHLPGHETVVSFPGTSVPSRAVASASHLPDASFSAPSPFPQAALNQPAPGQAAPALFAAIGH